VLQKCCERGCSQHPTSGVFLLSSPMLRPCCDYIAVMLRPVLRATSNIRSLFSLLLNTTPNTTCLQHRNATSATLKNNVCNTQTTHVCHIEIQHLQHRKLMIATSKNLDLILKHSYGTLATCQEHKCNMCATICKQKRETITS
jgi:hypothetical protein